MSLKPMLEARFTTELAPTYLEVVDESHRHAGHAGARGGGGHYIATIVSEAFAGKSLLERQRLVYALVAEEMRSGAIHALALTTKTPAEWEPGRPPAV
jgi:BolA protein